MFWPNSMSVSSLSPTMHILDVSRLKLQQGNLISHTVPLKNQQSMQSPELMNTLSENKNMHFWRKINAIFFLIIQLANLFKRKSIKKPEGFPTTMGSFCTEQLTAATIAPAPVEFEVTTCQLYCATDRNLKKKFSINFTLTIPGHSWADVICPVGSRLVAMKRQPGFSLIHVLAYLQAHRYDSIIVKLMI